ncbi:Fatty acid oxidation complex subunit alpha [Brevundimonas sp. NIBR10]|uniref:3-hydroxyacyl-CoA dehydrogenase NAD-binding domain-containing protein n=1 Tax=Brevundimonas sp. NIBR10 TaxID=3015997 RepID=UPI0022F1C5EE|nr:3-hydroxyacyl-CoA dehydrogenase NAD-binding domain-containing protein [Brevundimonas sp. NIBR10]WGM45935.1 Fatty acid oxidation complex subunit alpha [Brevundimonas sp. NIBR10]
MDGVITAERRDRVLVLTIDHPPVNALGHVIRQALLTTLEAARLDAGVDGVVLRGAGKLWSGGADIREFEAPVAPLLPEVLAVIEAFEKPIAAAVHGVAFGGGLELALACHIRIAETGAQLSLPEVTLGLLPGAGGTQRLPRLVGVPRALEMMTSGVRIGHQTALDWGLVDAVAEPGEAVDEAAGRVRAAAASRALRRTGHLPWPPGAAADIEAFVTDNPRRFRGAIAAGRIVEVVRETVDAPIAAGLVVERAGFEALRAGPQSAALRYSFFSDRAASRVPGLEDAVTRSVERVGVIGAGTMGTGIALALLQGGVEVVLMEKAPEALARGLAVIAAALTRNLEAGRLTEQAYRDIRTALSSTTDLAALSDVDLVIEAAFETLEVKREIFSQLDLRVRPGAILASNTSYLDIDAIAAATGRPDDVVGLHFFSPANIMKLLEIVKGAKTSPAVVATALALARRIGKTAVVAGNAHGFIGNRMLAIRKRESEAMVLEGASPYAIDRVIEAFGLPMGPFRMGDLAGLDLGWDARTSRGRTLRERFCEAGRRGQKSGAGFYDYTADRKAIRSQAAEDLIAAYRLDLDAPQREIADAEILDRLILPMVNEGAQILAEHKALRGSDIDVVWRNGYGWPAWRGGPMYWADAEGLASVVERLRTLAGRLGPQFAPSDLLVDLARTDGRLRDVANPALS